MNEIKSLKELLKIKNQSLSIVCCCTNWIAPCLSQKKIIEQISKQLPGAKPIYYLNLDRLPDLAWKLEIKTVPTILIFEQGKEKKRVTGLRSPEWFKKVLDQNNICK